MPNAKWILTAYFLSGASSLISEVVLVRLLKLTLGNTVYASSVVVSVFLGGLALGSFVVARRADRIKAPLRVYAVLECIIAVMVLLVPVALGLADMAYRALYAAWHPGPAALLPVQVLVSALLLLLPTMLMGATLPVMAVKVAGPETGEGAARAVGRLYAINTLGATAGCFLAGFVLIRELGVMLTLGFAAFLGLVAAFIAWTVAGSGDAAVPVAGAKPPEGQEKQGRKKRGPDSPPAAEAMSRSARAVLLCAGFLAGFVGIAYELLWIRSVINLVVATTYVFSAVLTIYLLGTMAGAWMASRIASKPDRCMPALAVAMAVVGVAGIVYIPVLVSSSAVQTVFAQPVAFWFERLTGVSGDVVSPLAMSFGLFFLPSVAVGMGFPLVLGAWRGGVGRVGASTGMLYGASTIGCVVGGFVTGFLLMPLLGVQKATLVAGLAAVAMGAVTMLFCGVWWRLAAPAVLVLGVGLAAAVPGDMFTRLLCAKLVQQYNATGVLYLKEGITTIASVHTQHGTPWTVPLTGTTYVQRVVRVAEDTRHIATSGMHVASDEPGQSSWQKFHGHSAMLLHGAANRVVCVGYGSGESVACVSRHDPKVLECVEISPEVVEAADRFFSHINLGAERDRHVRLIIADGKNYMHLTDARYDIVMSDPINPTFGENGSLYAKEYFENIRDHLDPGGLFLFWLPLHLPREVIESILATAMKVYPQVTMWTVPIAGGTFVQIVCSVSDQRFSPAAMDRKMADPRVGSDLARIGISSSADLLAHYRGDQVDLARCLTAPRINSDNYPVVEFSTRRAYFKETSPMILQLLRCGREGGVLDHVDWRGMGDEAKKNWMERQQATRATVVP